jgi:hypothetical protein
MMKKWNEWFKERLSEVTDTRLVKELLTLTQGNLHLEDTVAGYYVKTYGFEGLTSRHYPNWDTAGSKDSVVNEKPYRTKITLQSDENEFASAGVKPGGEFDQDEHEYYMMMKGKPKVVGGQAHTHSSSNEEDSFEYDTKEEAVKGHKSVVKQLKSGVHPMMLKV